MNILNDIVSGATKQFGREFGRAGANVILKGANSYAIRGASDYAGRIKPSDSSTVRAIKEVEKMKFVAINKSNTSRLIELTDLMLSNISFNGTDTLNELPDIQMLINQYQEKFNHGSALIDNDYQDKSTEYLEEKRRELVELLNSFSHDASVFIQHNLELAEQHKKSKKTAAILAFPILGALGIHKFYLGQIGQGIAYVIFSFTLIPAIIALFEFISYSSMTNEKFDTKFNPRFSYYRQFNTAN